MPTSELDYNPITKFWGRKFRGLRLWINSEVILDCFNSDVIKLRHLSCGPFRSKTTPHWTFQNRLIKAYPLSELSQASYLLEQGMHVLLLDLGYFTDLLGLFKTIEHRQWVCWYYAFFHFRIDKVECFCMKTRNVYLQFLSSSFICSLDLKLSVDNYWIREDTFLSCQIGVTLIKFGILGGFYTSLLLFASVL